MSHNTNLETEIKDVSALKKAAKECGVELIADVKPRMYFEHQHPNKADFILKCKGRYDVALNKDPVTKKYNLVFDEWGGDIRNQLGNGAAGKNGCVGKFLQSYAKHAAINAATAKGYSVAGTTTDAKGNINLVLNVPG